MRKILGFLFLVACVGTARAQMHASIDPRFELTSIAFRLAGASEYAQCGVPAYARDIDDHFLQTPNIPLFRLSSKSAGTTVSATMPFRGLRTGCGSMTAR